jgi:PBP1b-binding outer membrane lipoprotein LpoB
MKPIYITIFFVALVVGACSKNAETPEAKKEQLAELKSREMS